MSSSSDDEILNYFNELLGESSTADYNDEISPEDQKKETKQAQSKKEEGLVAYNESSKVLLSRAQKADSSSTISASPVNQKQSAHRSTQYPKGLKEDSNTIASPLRPIEQQPLEKLNTKPVDLEALDALQREKKIQLQALLDKGFEAKALRPEPQLPPVEEKLKTTPINFPPKVDQAEPPKVEAPVIPEKQDASITTKENSCSDVEFDFLAWGDNGRPQWAQAEFDALLFKVAGLKLAVPLVCLGQIYPIEEDLPQIFGQADWFMGVQATPIGKLRVVNTALFVMPEKYKPEFLKTARYVVSIDGIHWALAVDTVEQPIKLQPHDVTWRSQRGKRPWLAGTVKSAMCALIDIPNMGEMLEKSDRNRM